MNLLISYEHSGDFWVRYMVEFSTKLPSLGPQAQDKPIGELCPLGVDLKAPVFLHSKRCIEESDKTPENKAIFLIRNYRDVFVRKSFSKNIVDNSFYQKTYLYEGYDKYIAVLKDYEEWEGEKMLLYYEDLFSNSKKWIHEIFKFYNIDYKLADYILEYYERNFRCCIGIFRRSYPNSDLTAFPESMSPDIKLHMDDIIMYNSPFLFGKYLTRYMDT